jgi:hypothetical protein
MASPLLPLPPKSASSKKLLHFNLSAVIKQKGMVFFGERAPGAGDPRPQLFIFRWLSDKIKIMTQLTQRQAALAGKVTAVMQQAARGEGVALEVLRQGLAQGTVVVPANPGHRGLKPVAIGQGVRVKVNANIGTSPHDISLEKERAKLAP